jgi:flagellar basal-body rod protein FlgG
MSRLLNTAATGMRSMQLYIDNIANNLANVNTTAYKKSRIEFQDLIYQNMRIAGSSNLQGTFVPTSLQVGNGTRPASSNKIFTQGEITQTNNPLDVAVNGVGFFQINQPDGQILYSRDGSFKISDQGSLVTSDGFELEPQITIPDDAVEISIGADGTVQAKIFGQTDVQDLGQIELAKFLNPAGLGNVGKNLYEPTFASGDPAIGQPNAEGFGRIEQGFLETSNVEVVEELINMIQSQRAFEINSRVVQTGDDMLTTVNGMRR